MAGVTEKQIIALGDELRLVIEPVTIEKLEQRGVTYKAYKTYHTKADGEVISRISCVCECSGSGYYCNVSNDCENGIQDDCTHGPNGCSISCH